MKKEFVKSWKESKQPRKQRKYRLFAPLHIKSKFLNCNLSKVLRKKYGIRNIRVKKNDKVKIMRGSSKKKTGKVEMVDVKHSLVYVENIEQIRKDGAKSLKPLQPSNLQIIELDTSDKMRMKRFKQNESVKKSNDTKIETKTPNKTEKVNA